MLGGGSKEISTDNEVQRLELDGGRKENSEPHGGSMLKSPKKEHHDVKIISSGSDVISKGTKTKLEISCEANVKRLKTEEDISEIKKSKLDEQVVPDNVNVELVKKEGNGDEPEPMDTNTGPDTIVRSLVGRREIKNESDLLNLAKNSSSGCNISTFKDGKENSQDSSNIVKSPTENVEKIEMEIVPNDIDTKNTSSDDSILDEAKFKDQESDLVMKRSIGMANVEIKSNLLNVLIVAKNLSSNITENSTCVNESHKIKKENDLSIEANNSNSNRDKTSIAKDVMDKDRDSSFIVKSSSRYVEVEMDNVPNALGTNKKSSEVNFIEEAKIKSQESNSIMKSSTKNANVEIKSDLLNVPIAVENSSSDITEISIIEEVKAKDIVKIEEESAKAISPKRPREYDCGITEFIGKHFGFKAILKHRYSDFIVNEITAEGEIVKLTSFAKPVDLAPNVSKDVLKLLLPADTVEKIESLSIGSDLDDVSIDASEFDKGKRTEIHTCIKENYQSLTSSTDVDKDKRTIRIRPVSSKKKVERQIWPRGRPNFTHFVLYKENCDTSEAINRIASMLNFKPGVFNYAGTKDKRGKTSQMVSVKRVNAERLISLNKGMRNISVGNFSYKETPLKLGHLAGNSFTIILREIGCLDDDILIALFSLKDKGFINYYGMQRFGTTEVSTHQVGRALILENWQDAIHLILKPRTGDNPDMNMCRKIWIETKNADKALRALYNTECIEGQLLRGIKAHKPNDFVNALNHIPRNMRLMYIHAYQSYLFNAVASKRIAKYGLEPIVGDLYVPAQNEDSREDSVVGDKLKLEKDEKPTIVTQDDIDKKKVTIYDIVLPLPGTSIIYPENEATEWFKEILKDDGLDLSSFSSKVRVYALSGSYRHVLVKPKNMTWSFLTYHERNEDLCLGDWDLLNGRQLNLDKTGELKALKLIFDLPSSSYATMAVREITKQSLDVLSQSA